MGKVYEETFYQREYMEGKEQRNKNHEKILNIIHHREMKIKTMMGYHKTYIKQLQ